MDVLNLDFVSYLHGCLNLDFVSYEHGRLEFRFCQLFTWTSREDWLQA
jgi:hypothetical protein